MIWRLLWLLHLLPPLLLAARVCPRTLVSAADRLKVFGSGEVGLAVGHGHARVCRAVLMEGVGIRRGSEGKRAVAPSLTRRIQDILVAAGDFAAELDSSGQNWWRLVGEDCSRQALGAAQSARVYGGLALEGGAEG